MAATQPATLTWQASTDTTTRTSYSENLPEEVAVCLQNARFLHLATCIANMPHVSLMNYTYLPSHPFNTSQLRPGPIVVMTSNTSSKKAINLQANPHVSLLVHDWVSARPPQAAGARERSPDTVRTQRSSLANMLMQMNSAAVSSISATINGQANILESNSEEERWCKEQHLVNNTFEDDEATAAVAGSSPSASTNAGDGGRSSYIAPEDAKVVVVRIRDGRISDWKGGVKDWMITEPAGINDIGIDAGGGPMVNGFTG